MAQLIPLHWVFDLRLSLVLYIGFANWTVISVRGHLIYREFAGQQISIIRTIEKPKSFGLVSGLAPKPGLKIHLNSKGGHCWSWAVWGFRYTFVIEGQDLRHVEMRQNLKSFFKLHCPPGGRKMKKKEQIGVKSMNTANKCTCIHILSLTHTHAVIYEWHRLCF